MPAVDPLLEMVLAGWAISERVQITQGILVVVVLARKEKNDGELCVENHATTEMVELAKFNLIQEMKLSMYEELRMQAVAADLIEGEK